MSPNRFENGHPLPERPTHHTYISLTEKVRCGGVIMLGEDAQEVVDSEIENWAQSEWSIVTRLARKDADKAGLDEANWIQVMQKLRERHKTAWGPYGDDRPGDKG